MRLLHRLAMVAWLGLGCGLLPQSAIADTAENARAAALQILNAIDQLTEARQASDQVEALTRAIQAHEAGLSALRVGLRETALREATVNALLEQQQEQVSRMLGAMMAVERVEGPVLLVHPQGPLATARAGMMLVDLAAALQAEADRIGALARELTELRALRETAIDAVDLGLQSLQQARTELSQAISERRALPPRVGDDETRLLRLLESVRTLDELASGLAQQPTTAVLDMPLFEAARGRLPMPVVGQLLHRFNQADAAGVVRPGLVVATEPGVLVTAPWFGSVRYAGPLLTYGNVILLEPGEGFLLVIAGLDQIYPRTGDVVAQGAALGMMPGRFAHGDEFVRPDAVAARSETLYLELRSGGEPIDPADWFDLTAQ